MTHNVYKVVFQHPTGRLSCEHVFARSATQAGSFIEKRFHATVTRISIGDPMEYDGTWVYTPDSTDTTMRIVRCVHPDFNEEEGLGHA